MPAENQHKDKKHFYYFLCVTNINGGFDLQKYMFLQ